jgi:hypothetical protein
VRSRLPIMLQTPVDHTDAMPPKNPTLVDTKRRYKKIGTDTNIQDDVDDDDDDDDIDLPARITFKKKDKWTSVQLKERICAGRWCGTCGHDLYSGGQCQCLGDDDDGPNHWCTTCGFVVVGSCICIYNIVTDGKTLSPMSIV